MYNPMRLDGQRIMVTGASSGLGRACAQVISRLGGEVVLVARNEGRLLETLASLEGVNHQVEIFDLADTEAIPTWMKAVVARGGKPLSGLVHCAGIEITQPVRTMKLGDYERLMNINVTAAFALAKAFRQRNVANIPSSIVLVSSVAALKAQAGLVAYATSKAALLGMAKTLAAELARDHVRVNVVTPGLVKVGMGSQMLDKRTEAQLAAIEDMHFLGLGQPEDVAHSVAFLLADTGRWITGSNLVVDGGYSIH